MSLLPFLSFIAFVFHWRKRTKKISFCTLFLFRMMRRHKPWHAVRLMKCRLHERKIKTNPTMERACSNEVPSLSVNAAACKGLALLSYRLRSFHTCPQLKSSACIVPNSLLKIIVNWSRPLQIETCVTAAQVTGGKKKSHYQTVLLLETRKTQNNLWTPMPRCNLIIYGSVVSFLV